MSAANLIIPRMQTASQRRANRGTGSTRLRGDRGKSIQRRGSGNVSHWEKSVGKTDEWYTPKSLFDALGETFDLDVASPPTGPVHVPTKTWLHEGSLETPWRGFVFMNPPFGGRNALVPWLDKFFDHNNGLALTPDRTSAPWFWGAWGRADAVAFTRKLRFVRPDGSEGVSPSNGCALWASGERAVCSLRRATDAGFCILGKPL